ncbi:MAG: HAMP domain-containing sensor histidine kinase [Pseudomonadota bacterium]
MSEPTSRPSPASMAGNAPSAVSTSAEPDLVAPTTADEIPETPTLDAQSLAPPRPVSPPPRGAGLSARLLAITVVAVMIAEVLIFLPSVANFRMKWLMDRLEAAQIVALAAEDSPNGELSPMLQDEILTAARVRSVAVKKDTRRLVAQDNMPPRIDAFYDLRSANMFTLIRDAVLVYFHGPKQSIRVIGTPQYGKAEFVEIVVDEAPLKAAMIEFGLNILALSIAISIFAATLVYLALNWLMVRPMQRMVRAMEHYAVNPEDATRILVPSARRDEIGIAEHELAQMQGALSQLLTQKNRLAGLGLAVSKINHDLRNMLASAQIISDRFAASDDPIVKRFAPKLLSALDRAVDLCQMTLRYGRADEPRPQRTRFALAPLVLEVADQLGLPSGASDGAHGTDEGTRALKAGGDEAGSFAPSELGPGPIGFSLEIADDLIVYADRDQLYRVLSNVMRNAGQVVAAMSGAERAALEGRIDVTAVEHAGAIQIDIRDTGPGFPLKARDALFQAFQGAARKGGTGLGLAIANELVKAHGGSLRLVEEDTALINGAGESVNGQTRGAHFEIVLPPEGGPGGGPVDQAGQETNGSTAAG